MSKDAGMPSPPRQTSLGYFTSGLPRALGEKYLLVEEVGHGGMASVHLALTQGIGGGRLCAVKTVAYQQHTSDDAFLSTRFLAEAAAVARLQHDNLVFVFDSGLVGRELYLAMEFIEGKTLAEILAHLRSAGEAMPVGLAMWVTLELLAALSYVHRKGYVHRDVSPSNVMVSVSGGVKLLDFGLARPVGEGHQTGMVTKLGKAGYVAPEQFLGAQADARSDLFSAGVILWELLTGRAWLSPGTDRKRQSEYVAPQAHRPDVPAELGELLRIALAPDPLDRFQSASEFTRDLSQYLAPGDYRKRLGSFLSEAFWPALQLDRERRDKLIASLESSVSVAPNASDVGPIKKIEDYVGLILAERYEIKRLIATGAMGAVYEGRHIGIDRKVAIKIPFFRGNSDLRARFVREAQTTSRINDPHIVAVTDAGETPQGDAFVIMEFLEGESLESAIAKRGVFAVEEALTVAEQMGRAMEAAHEAGVIHRDLKPANVMLVPTRHGTTVKVLDFGIAGLLGKDQAVPVDGLTLPETALGTPKYMAPEQITSAGAVDVRADVYAAATVLYEMLTGQAPFAISGAEEVCMAKLHSEPKDIREWQPNLDGALCQLVMEGLSRDPKHRPATATIWRTRIERLRPERRRRSTGLPNTSHRSRRIWIGILLSVAVFGIVAVAVMKKKQVPLARDPATNLERSNLPVHAEVIPHVPAAIDTSLDSHSNNEPRNEVPVAGNAPAQLRHPPRVAKWQESLREAQAEFGKGHFVPSLLAAKRAARLGGGAPALVLVGRANLEMGEREDALSAFQSALELDPQNKEARRGLERLGKGD